MPAISVDRLQPGVFISLEAIGWMEHPFLLNRFRIADGRQIQALRRMGLTSVEWDPQRSTAGPLPDAAAPPQEEDFTAGALDALLHNKRDRVEQVREKREGIARCARLFEQETGLIRQIMSEMGPRPNDAHAHSRALVDRLVSGLVEAKSVAVHLVNLKKSETGSSNHAMNVMVLSLLIGKSIGISAEEMKDLGLGALLHDVGLSEIPTRVHRNLNRTAAEEKFYRAHTGYGLKVVAPMKGMPVTVKNIIACHHESWDGKGYPNGLTGTKIPKLARIVAIANRYDNLCNPLDPKTALTPAEAVAQLFKKEGEAHDPAILSAFVKALGVYPPGTFVSLNDGSIGLVIESNSQHLLRPLLMLYDASVPRNEALLLDISEADEKIEAAIAPRDIPREVIEYLAPQGRVDFYLEGAS
ncbi:cyclic di-GMP phosphodiesterase response regulator RpfG [mine drainage metagenome]|uniref:Cyclic di-GMP phosphodiesterase response regulator RpfG n=1 Tax=mine drainage metagenome TaxID=410659 RepID=A0A1J5SC32_9ZZZZ